MKDKLLKFINSNKWTILTGLISLVCVSIIYTVNKIAPFGNNSMLDVDFYHQYGPLLNELYDRVKEGSSLLYSFNTAGGLPFYRNFLNYLSSPFNIILFLFKRENIVMAFSIIIGLKAVFASVSMSYYLKKTFKKDGLLTCLFGVLYAFSGYFCAYYWNIMWLDGMAFLPLIMLGINKIIDEDNPVVYIVFLAIMLFANYFISYMVCIFSVIYFIGLFIYRGNFKIKNILKKILMFALSSALAAGLVSFMLIPLAHSLSSISATGDTFPELSSSFKISDFIFNHFTGVKKTVFASDTLPLPNVYPGMLTLVLILLIFMNKKINLKFKIMSLLIILFFFFSFNVTTLDFVCHAFHVPNDLPYRYSFIYVFVLITLGYYSILRIKDVNIFMLSISFGIIFILVLVSNKLGFENINDAKTIICLILLVLYYLIIILFKIKGNKRLIYSIFTITVMFEAIYGICINWDINHDIKNFMSDKKPYQSLISKIKKDDNDLYRIEKTDYLTLNDGAWYNYRGISTFTSMAYESTAKAQRNLGLAGNNINSYYYKDYNTPVYNTMFNIKYLLGDYIENEYYVPIYSKDSYNAIGYNYSSQVAYAVSNDIKSLDLISYDPFFNQSNFVSSAYGVKDIFEKIKVDSVSGGKFYNLSGSYANGEYNYKLDGGSKELTVTLDNAKKDNIYLYVGGSNMTSFTVNDKYHSITSDEYYVLDLGNLMDDKVNVRMTFDKEDDGFIYFYAYYLNKDSFEKFYSKIKKNMLNVTSYNDTKINGTITVSEDKTLFTTISYDDGWSIYVDGKKVKTKKVLNAFLSCDIKRGTHDIKMIYYPKKMKEGLIVSMISLVIFIMYNIFLKKGKNKNMRKDEFIV